MRLLAFFLIPAAVLSCSCSGEPQAPSQNSQHEPWHTTGDPGKRPFASRQNTTITLWPSKATFKIPESWVESRENFGNNLHLTRAQIDAVAQGEGDWDTEFASVCNTVLPIDRCSAHVGDEGWGKQGVAYSDLQVRVYDLPDTAESLERRIKREGTADIRRFSGKEPVLEEMLDVPWRRTLLSFDCWYGDYGATAHIDFRVRAFEDRTIVFAFMYTAYQSQEQAIASILGSFGLQQ